MFAKKLKIPAKGNIRVGIVGLGKMGMLQWHTWRKISGVSLVAVTDTDPLKEEWAHEQGLAFFPESAQLIGHVDLAIVSSPSPQHLGCALSLLNAGVHCLVEKPLAMNLAESELLVAAANRHHTLLAVGHSERFNFGVQQACAALRLNMRLVQVFRMAPMATPSLPTSDVVQDLMIHDLDWIMHAFGETPGAISIQDAHWRNDILSSVTCLLDFSGGRQVQLSASCISTVRRREVILHGNSNDCQVISLGTSWPQSQMDPLSLQAHALLQALSAEVSQIALGRDILSVMAVGDRIRSSCIPTEAVAS